MENASMDTELLTVLGIAREAAEIVRAVYRTTFAVEMKGPNDPVTRADREANTLICARLAETFPGVPIIAEETPPETAAEARKMVQNDRVFFVDPLDGTREFADRNPEFAVMIGLAVGGRATLGVVVMPESGEALCGRVGASSVAFVEGPDGVRRPLRVSDQRDPSKATMMVSRSHRPRLVEPLATRLGVRRVVPCGSVGVKVARVSTGEAEIYVHGGTGAKLWDTCGPEAILVAAGGRFSDLDGAPIDYAYGGLKLENGLVATNAALYDTVIEAISALS
ncbi:3'(2'),5'-bisphosphate nucleotidase CysQ family protein [Polyangium jinanense]|uniref:3'(2'),5'-bisphosphate nucleotidase CysQ n=1 Tax=Polyangium jinanense TaxID=2829994 RepID=A0A9X4ASG5_9BACT|nr:3'(2'),5'-bisphosphate nucleotidase CysQ [Polyangium jinanense]MDC3955120.1 3'(2'),5'-bisphosphate nucleotidase CysQ [Polyangium jinanense]MDC3981110.1 3'(2'),5'-bisphosphate nucleotidase CysQ [Polyangium jinanense]